MGLAPYKPTWDYQQQLCDQLIARKMQMRGGVEMPAPLHHLIMCSHPPVFTLGKSGSAENLLVSLTELSNKGMEYYHINRGGDITYHGPGQLVMYPIFDLEYFFTDIHKFLRLLEEAVIATLADFGLKGGRYPGYTGVWLEPEHPEKARKICAMGIRCSRWVTMHGIAFNINNDLSPFEMIVPCGIKDKDVTSLKRELGTEVEMNEVMRLLAKHMAHIFDFEYENPD
jgi:lipoyl(octanoyl) transferase